MDGLSQTPVISNTQVESYHSDGYVVVSDIFSTDDLQRMRAALDQMVAGAAGITENNAIYDLEVSHTPEVPRVRRIKDPFYNHPVFTEMARHPRLISVLTGLLGPDVRMHGSKINLKSAEYGASVEWHQDWAFYPHTNDDVLAVGVMLDDMTQDNGPLLMIPSTHTGPTYDHHQDGRFMGAIDPDACDLDFSKADKVTGTAGSCSFHHVRTVHGSAQNTSGKDRRLLLFQIAAGDAWDICGMKEANWEEYCNSMLAGTASLEPRQVATPIRLPYPVAEREGSIYENQSVLKNRYFKS